MGSDFCLKPFLELLLDVERHYITLKDTLLLIDIIDCWTLSNVLLGVGCTPRTSCFNSCLQFWCHSVSQSKIQVIRPIKHSNTVVTFWYQCGQVHRSWSPAGTSNQHLHITCQQGAAGSAVGFPGRQWAWSSSVSPRCLELWVKNAQYPQQSINSLHSAVLRTSHAF